IGPVGAEPRVYDLQRHPVFERLVLSLIDDSHAPLADDAEDAVVAQPLGMRWRGPCGRVGPWRRRLQGTGGRLDAGLELLHLDQGREQLADLVGPRPPGWHRARVR